VNQKRVDCVVRGQNCLQNRKVSFEVGFEGGLGVDRSKMRRDGVPNRGASMPKTTRGESNLGTRLGEKIEGGGAKLTWGAVAEWLTCRLLNLLVAGSNPGGDTFSTRNNLE